MLGSWTDPQYEAMVLLHLAQGLLKSIEHWSACSKKKRSTICSVLVELDTEPGLG